MVSAVKRLTYFKEEIKCLKIHRNKYNQSNFVYMKFVSRTFRYFVALEISFAM